VSIEAELLKDLEELNDLNSQLLQQKTTFESLSEHLKSLKENKET